eukprot:CAMPEP_0185800846 /NCGR_PEP_ID=MMETSP1322-20130828/1102_1 /TAXON_ID=265543 /ORGANISM="Minutocellus polymorphus, Strain RCC2270" /LENGTH=287 /DNA_ID=CAMNT_0028496507 /DNA_START=22 /DNA_END=881 /DNA_ORIENTATION=+
MKGRALIGAVVLRLLIQVSCGFAFSTTRRDVLNEAVAVPAAAAAAVVTTFGGAPPATAAQTTAEAIRRTAGGIPGYGQPDVYFPTSYLGRWRAKKTIVVSDNPYLDGLLPVTLNYEMRFISVDGDSKEEAENAVGGKVVADRAFNEQSYYKALRNVVMESSNGGSSKVPPALRSVIWVPTNPNVLSSTYDDGTTQEIKVTKRAATLQQDGAGTASSSEYRRISDVGVRGIPILSASRVLTKWRSDGESVEAIEIVYADGVMGDPMGGAGGAVAKQGAPVASTKARIS